MARRSAVVGALVMLAVSASVSAFLSGCGQRAHDVGLLAAVTPLPSGACRQGATLAALLDATGVAHDYEPTASPRELATVSDAVLRGRLTGLVLPVRSDDDVYVDLEMDLAEVVLGEELQGLPPLSRLRLVVAPDRLPDTEQTVPALEGAEVVAFVELRPDATGRSAGLVGVPFPQEGLMTSCGDRLGGWAGGGDGWSIASLDEVTLAALGPPADVVALQGPWVQVAGTDREELEIARGPEHCDWESVLSAGLFPSGRLFVRDPEGAMPLAVGPLITGAAEPVGTPQLAWEQEDDGRTLRAVLGAEDDALTVQTADGRWERWPEIVPAVGCA